MRRTFFLISLLVSACSGPSTVPERQIVRLQLPQGGFIAGDDQANTVAVEFGSYGCAYCQTVADDLFTVIRAHPRDGIQWRYVEMTSDVRARRVSAIVECLSRHIGTEAAMHWGFRAASDTLAFQSLLSGSDKTDGVDRANPSCIAAAAGRIGQEQERAHRLGVGRVPTFVIGKKTREGDIIGWFLEDQSATTIRETLLEAHRLINNVPEEP